MRMVSCGSPTRAQEVFEEQVRLALFVALEGAGEGDELREGGFQVSRGHWLRMDGVRGEEKAKGGRNMVNRSRGRRFAKDGAWLIRLIL